MTYMLRDRPDGQVEIIVHKPVLVGVFPERDVAERFCVWLQEDDAFGQVDDAPAGFATAAADVADVEAETVVETAPPALKLSKPRQERHVSVPAVIDKPTPTAMLPVFVPQKLTEVQIDAAFARIADGEKIAVVAPDFGLTLNQLRGMWAYHKRQMQRHLSEGGKENCVTCQRPFVPSITNPDKCARCSHE